jgi:hypothetical protein
VRSSIGRPHLILIIYNYNRNSGVSINTDLARGWLVF